MALTYGFYNSVKGDRKYDAMQFSEIIDTLIIDGIIPSKGQLFAVTTASNGMQINVGTGMAWFFHSWTKNDSVMVLTVEPSDITRPRIDAVVLEVNREDAVRANSIKIVKGEPNVNAEKPTLVTTQKVHQYPLAWITVPAAAEEIKAENIENAVGLTPTVFATGILETVPLNDLWSQWEGEWDTWFAAIKLQLSGDIVTNLQLQIEELKEKLTLDDGTDIKEAILNLENKTLAKIGDVKITVRKNLGRAWALANGAEITDQDVLNNVGVLDPKGTAWVTNSTRGTSSPRARGCDSKRGIFAEITSEPTNGTVRIRYTSNFKNWANFDVRTGLTSTTHTFKLLEWSEYLGKWIIAMIPTSQYTTYFVSFSIDNSVTPVILGTLPHGQQYIYFYKTSNDYFYYIVWHDAYYRPNASDQKYSRDLINWTEQPVEQAGLSLPAYTRTVIFMEYSMGYYYRYLQYQANNSDTPVTYVYRSGMISSIGTRIAEFSFLMQGPNSIKLSQTINDGIYVLVNGTTYYIYGTTYTTISPLAIGDSNSGYWVYPVNSSKNRILLINGANTSNMIATIYEQYVGNASLSTVANINTSTSRFGTPFTYCKSYLNSIWWTANSNVYYIPISYYLPKIALDNAYCYIKVRDE